MMIAVAIYIDNRRIAVDCTDLMKGNPGIGGTEYSILLLAQVLHDYVEGIKVILILEKEAKMPTVDNVFVVSSLEEVAAVAKDADILLLSARREGKPLDQSFFDDLEKEKIRTILWAHNYHYSDYCKRISRCKAIRANVFVGKQQYDRYIDNEIIEKSTYIYNMYPHKNITRAAIPQNHNVTYIGSLVPEKGFHVLAKAWKEIVKAVPDAELNVIGSGKLYDANQTLGKHGIAEESYENTFIPFLLDNDGKISDAVHFLGVLGPEKDHVILNTSVGVVNPTGRTETFGISALDFESMAVPVVTIGKGGFLDTVINKETGVLTKDIKKAVVDLLLDEEKNVQYGNAGAKLALCFEPKVIVEEWVRLFELVISDGPISYKQPDNYYNNNLKWLRMLNRHIKNILNVSRGVSVIGVESKCKSILRRIGH